MTACKGAIASLTEGGPPPPSPLYLGGGRGGRGEIILPVIFVFGNVKLRCPKASRKLAIKLLRAI